MKRRADEPAGAGEEGSATVGSKRRADEPAGAGEAGSAKLVLDPEQEELRTVVRRLLADRSPMAKVREAVETGPDPGLWRALGEIGVLALVVPEELGGAGAGHVERAIVLEELGRALTPSPYLASAVLATDTLLALDDDEARAEWLPRLAAGQVIATVAVGEGRGLLEAGGATTATRRGGRWELDGTKTPVLAGDAADLVLVHTPAGWFAAEGGFARTPLSGLDPTRRLARLDFDGTPARPLNGTALDVVADLAAVAVAAEQVGVMRRAMELTVDYAKVRVQFGRPIGSYQAVKHGCADMYAAWELALSVLRHAAWSADHDPAGLPLAAALAQVYAGPACFEAATGMVQYHGGIGYTWEHDAHLYYKRAKSLELLLGPPARHRARLADRLGV